MQKLLPFIVALCATCVVSPLIANKDASQITNHTVGSRGVDKGASDAIMQAYLEEIVRALQAQVTLQTPLPKQIQPLVSANALKHFVVSMQSHSQWVREFHLAESLSFQEAELISTASEVEETSSENNEEKVSDAARRDNSVRWRLGAEISLVNAYAAVIRNVQYVLTLQAQAGQEVFPFKVMDIKLQETKPMQLVDFRALRKSKCPKLKK